MAIRELKSIKIILSEDDLRKIIEDYFGLDKFESSIIEFE